MNRKKYYRLLEEYNEMISQKYFNVYLCEQNELDKIKEALIKEIRKFITSVTANMIEEEKMLCQKKPLTSVKYQWMQEKRNKLDALYHKISGEEKISKEDYEDTYYLPQILCGLTAYELMAALVASGIITLAHWFVNH